MVVQCPGKARNASSQPRLRPAWISTRSAATTPGTGTSRWPCWRTATCPSLRRPPRKPWQRPHPGHARRGPPSPGTLNRPAFRPQRSPGLVHLAQAPPAPRQTQPLPAKTSPDPFAAWPARTVFAAVRRPAKGLSSARPVHPQAAGRCAARTRTPTAAALKCRVSSVNQGRKHDDAGKHHQCHDEGPRRNAWEAPGTGLPAHPAVPITIVKTPHGKLLTTLPWWASCLYLTVTAGQLQSGKRIVTNSETRGSGPDHRAWPVPPPTRPGRRPRPAIGQVHVQAGRVAGAMAGK